MAEDQVTQGEDVNVTDASGTATEVTETTGETDTSTGKSSASEETDQTSEESSSAEDTKDLGGKFVPYDRFREKNERVKELEEENLKLKDTATEVSTATAGEPKGAQQEQIKQAIKGMGFMSKDEVQEQLSRKDDDNVLRQELSRLEIKHDGSDGRPKFNKNKVVKFALDKQIGDPESAYKILNEKALTDWQIKQALDKSKGIVTETSDGSGSANVGTTDDDLKKAIKAGDRGALRTFLKRRSPSD